MCTKDRYTDRLQNAATVLEKTINAAGRAVGDGGLETVGASVQDALDELGDKIGLTPACGWLGNVLKGIFSVAAAVFKAFFGMLGWVLAGLIKIIGGILTWQRALLLDGAWDIFSSVLGSLILFIGKLGALFQSLVYAQGFECALTSTEKSELARVFKDRLNYHAVRIITGHSGIFGFSPRPFALGNTIYMKTPNYSLDILVHEVTHTWQYQQYAGRYASDALMAQWFIPDAYNWQKEIDERHKTTWQALNKEAQAEFLRDIWRQAELRDITGTVLQNENGSFYDADDMQTFGYFATGDKDRTEMAGNAIKTIRGE